jgi:hypothetical protein
LKGKGKSFCKSGKGYVAFTAKTKLLQHYVDVLGAQLIYGRERMGIFTKAIENLVNSYFQEYFSGRR